MTNRLICGTILAIAAVTSLALSLGGTAERATAGSLTTNSSTLFSSTQNFIKHERLANAAS